MNNEINPWGSTDIQDYSKLFQDFGISPFEDLIPTVPKPNKYIRRNIIFGHRGYGKIIEAIKNNEPFAVMSGFMPSGHVHLGHKMVMDQIIWHQKMGGDAFVGIADREAYSVRGSSWEMCKEIGINEYILSLIALGFKPDGHIYFQSESDKIMNLAFELGVKVNFSEMSSIYGFSGNTNISHTISALCQSADILNPQVEDNSGPKPTVIPVGADQDPHIRLTRGLANKMNLFRIEQRTDKSNIPYYSVRGKSAPNEALLAIKQRFDNNAQLFEGHVDIYEFDDYEKIAQVVREVELKYGGYAFMPPVSTYHRFMTGLQGGKMSSSSPESYIALTDNPKDAAKKIMRSKTGGRISSTEQRELGGVPENCSIFEIMLFHLVEDDKELKRIHQECKNGELLCGHCKKYAAEIMNQFLTSHQIERENAKSLLEEYGISYKN